MKKVLSIAFMILVAIGCQQSKYGQAGENAIQYVYEQMPEKRQDIKSVEIIREDSVLSSILYSFATSELFTEKFKYLDKEISLVQYRHFVDSLQTLSSDVSKSWIMDKEWTDSLKQLSKYKDAWRKAFLIEVTMKSNKQIPYRVSMDNDGITPSMITEQFIKEQKEFNEELSRCYNIE